MKMYHPTEFKKTRPYYDQLARVVINHGIEDPSATSELVKFMEKAQIIHRSKVDQWRAKVHEEYQACIRTVTWVEGGRAIYDFPPLLLDEFSNTDIDEINTSDIHLPFGGFYMNLENSGIFFGKDLIVGAYIYTRPDGAVEFQATGKADKPGMTQFHHEPIIYGDDSLESVDQLVEQHVFEGLNWSRKVDQVKDASIVNLMNGIRIQEFKNSYGFSSVEVDEIQAIVKSKESINYLSEILTPALTEQVLMRKKFVSLVFNCLLYMSAFPDDRDNGFAEPSVDKALAKAYFDGREKEFKKAKAQVLKSGYTPVITIGTSFERELERSGYEVGKSSISAHWRRGHWRKIKDKANPEIKRLVRVKACRVGFSKSDDEIDHAGHIYQLEEKKS